MAVPAIAAVTRYLLGGSVRTLGGATRLGFAAHRMFGLGPDGIPPFPDVPMFQLRLGVVYQQVTAQLAKAGVHLDRKQLLTAIGLAHMRWITDNIRKGGTPPWKRMSENTLTVSPQRRGPHHFSSRYSSRLLQALSHKVRDTSVVVGIDDEFAAYHHFGTNPYTILPRSGKFLAFPVASGVVATRLGVKKPVRGSTDMAFAKGVHHPGLPARPLIPTKAVAERMAIEVMRAAAMKMAKAVK